MYVEAGSPAFPASPPPSRRRIDRTLLEWLTERRLAEARRFLRETDLPLSIISTRTVLTDHGYLVRPSSPSTAPRSLAPGSVSRRESVRARGKYGQSLGEHRGYWI